MLARGSMGRGNDRAVPDSLPAPGKQTIRNKGYIEAVFGTTIVYWGYLGIMEKESGNYYITRNATNGCGPVRVPDLCTTVSQGFTDLFISPGYGVMSAMLCKRWQTCEIKAGK